MSIREAVIDLKQKALSFINSREKDFVIFFNIIIIVLFNIVVSYFPFRVDLTRNNIYSLSQTSKDIVSNLSERLKIKVFFSSDLPPERQAVFRYLRDILQEYDLYGNENFSYEIIEGSNLESQATEYGINPIPSEEFSSDQVKLRSVYMGLVIIHGDL
ncbi:MAG TPA: Gldg family protein, partial [Spirochaetota bacterium]|nr:Gldg family protein [Spirochaetota bacterium]